MRKMFSSLRNRVLLLIAIPFAVMFGMTADHTLGEREKRLADARERVLGTTRLMAAEQRRIIDRSHQILLSVALLPELRRGTVPDACGRVLSQKVKEGGVFVNMLVALPDGDAICNATITAQPVNIADRDFFQRALQTHEFMVGDYIISRSTGKPAIGIAYPLLDEAGRPELVVSATLNLGWLEREMAKFDLPEGSHAVMLDSRGNILARHPDPGGWAGKSAPPDMPLARIVFSHSAEGTADELGLDGVRRIFAFMPLHQSTTGQVYLWVGIPKDAIVGPVERDFVSTLLVAFALLALTFGAFWLGSERLFLRRIAALGEAAARLGKGELATRTGLQPGRDEIAQLAQSFDRMAEGLEAKQKQLIRSNRAIRVILAGNQAMLRATSEQQLIGNLCRAIVEAGGYRMAWIGYAENDAEKTIRPVAQGGAAAEGFFENSRLTWSDTGSGQTPAGQAIRSGTPVAIQNIQKETSQEPWWQNARRCGCGSCVALPLRIGHRVIGVLDVYAEETGAFSNEEVGLLGAAAADLSYGIAALRGAAEQAPLKAALRTAELHFRAAADASLDALFILKSVRDRKNDIVDFEFVDINPSAEQMLGVAREKVIGERFCELLPVFKTEGFLEKYARIVATGVPLEEEFPIDTPEIKAKWLRHQVVRVDDGIAISSRNITTWKAVGAQLRASEEKYRTLFEESFDGLSITSPEGKILDMNRKGVAMFGYDTKEEIQRLDLERDVYAHPPDRQRMLSMVNAQGAAEYEVVVKKKNGEHMTAYCSLTAVRDEKGAITSYRGIIRDITERKRAQAALQQSEVSLKEAQRIAHLGNWELDLVTHVLSWSDEIYRIFEIDPGKFGASYEAFLGAIHPEDRESVDKAYADSVRNKIPYEIVHRLLMKDGRVKYVHERGETFYDPDGRPLHSIGTVQDITARKQGELALERANRALRTLGACNEALVHAGNESELLAAICRLIVETGGYRMAWVGFPEQDPAKTVRPVARYGHDEGYLEAAKISWADSERGRGPTGTAVRTGTVQVNQNFLTNPALAPWREAAQPRGYQSNIALPLKSSAGTLGVLTIYAPEPDAFNDAEVTLLRELAEELAFGIETLRTRAEHNRIAYEHLHHAEILRQSLEDSIKAIADTVEMRDPYTAGHQRRVGQLAAAISRELGLPEETIHGIELAASIHDLGKISVPAEILAKPTKLTDIESMLVKNHAQAGYDILKDIKFPWPIATMVWQHHERLDGSGYPQGLKGDQILLESRIMAVADVVEAMASHRPYRAALGIDIALKEMERGRGTAYDAAAVDACIRLFTEKRFALST